MEEKYTSERKNDNIDIENGISSQGRSSFV